MEPYERLLSPVNKKGPRKRLITHHYSTRMSSSQSHLEQALQSKDRERNEGDKEEEKSKEDEGERKGGGGGGEKQEGKEEEEEGAGDNSEESEEEEEEEEEMEGETSYYNLRKRRPMVYQYQPVIQVRTCLTGHRYWSCPPLFPLSYL